MMRYVVILWLRGRGRVVEEVNATTAADAEAMVRQWTDGEVVSSIVFHAPIFEPDGPVLECACVL